MSVHGGWIVFSANGNIRSLLKHITRNVVTNFIAKNYFFGLKKIKISVFRVVELDTLFTLCLYFKGKSKIIFLIINI